MIMAVFAAVAMLSSCSDGGKYVQRGDTICYTYWTFSFGRLYDTLPEVRPESFQTVNDWLGHDGTHVYFKGKLVRARVDIPSLKAKKYPLFCDQNDYYYEDAPIHVADVSSYKIIKWCDENVWAKDSRYAYFDTVRIEADIATFEMKGWNTAVDKNHVYRYGKILPLADPATYVEDWKGLYSRDKSHIWYCGELLEDVDYATFDVDKEGVASDKNGKFHGAERITDEE